jgi:hypothetical protein
MGKYPISRICPSCGEDSFKRARPKAAVSFASDRICRACGTRYTPPTPAWAGVVFVLAGLPMAFYGLLGVFLGVFFGGTPEKGGPFGLLIFLVLALAGIIAIVHGVRSFINAEES